MKIFDSTDLSLKKEKSILKLIYQNKSISRPELLELSKLKIATLYRTIDSLVSKGVAVVSKSDESASVGRPSDLLTMNSSFAYVFSIAVRRYVCIVALIDFSNQIVFKQSFELDESLSPQELIARCHHLYIKAISELKIDDDKVLGVTISTFGIPKFALDDKNVQEYPGFKWHNFEVVTELKRVFSKPVQFEYNARSAVQGNYISRYIRHYKNLAYVIIDEGIGLGLIIDDRIIRGDHRFVNGLGHMVMDINGSKCICGKYGCMETKVSKLAIVSSALAELRLGRDSMLKEKESSLTYLDVLKAGDQGDRMASYVIESAALIFALGLENVLNILDIELIIIGGGFPESSHLFCETVKNKLAKSFPNLKIETGTDETDMILKGSAAAFILDRLK